MSWNGTRSLIDSECRACSPLGVGDSPSRVQLAMDTVRHAGVNSTALLRRGFCAETRSYRSHEGPEGTYLAANEILQNASGGATFSAQVKPRKGSDDHVYITGASVKGLSMSRPHSSSAWKLRCNYTVPLPQHLWFGF